MAVQSSVQCSWFSLLFSALNNRGSVFVQCFSVSFSLFWRFPEKRAPYSVFIQPLFSLRFRGRVQCSVQSHSGRSVQSRIQSPFGRGSITALGKSDPKLRQKCVKTRKLQQKLIFPAQNARFASDAGDGAESRGTRSRVAPTPAAKRYSHENAPSTRRAVRRGSRLPRVEVFCLSHKMVVLYRDFGCACVPLDGPYAGFRTGWADKI